MATKEADTEDLWHTFRGIGRDAASEEQGANNEIGLRYNHLTERGIHLLELRTQMLNHYDAADSLFCNVPLSCTGQTFRAWRCQETSAK